MTDTVEPWQAGEGPWNCTLTPLLSILALGLYLQNAVSAVAACMVAWVRRTSVTWMEVGSLNLRRKPSDDGEGDCLNIWICVPYYFICIQPSNNHSLPLPLFLTTFHSGLCFAVNHPVKVFTVCAVHKNAVENLAFEFLTLLPMAVFSMLLAFVPWP